MIRNLTILLVALLVPLVASPGTAVFAPGSSPQRVRAVTQANGVCDSRPNCVTDVSIPPNAPVELMVHDNGTIRKGTRSELVALGIEFEGEAMQARYLRAVVQETCAELRALGMTSTCAQFKSAIETRAAQ